MKKNNKKGFTLIELLAVIVILAILLAVALPKVTQYITRSRKDSLVTTAKDFASAVLHESTIEEFELPIGTDDVTIISIDLIQLAKGGTKSPFNGKWVPQYSYVAIVNAGTDEEPAYKYFVALTDTKRYTIPLTLDDLIERDTIVRNNTSRTKASIQSMCGSIEGKYKVLQNITGLEDYRPAGGWNATIYSSVGC